jgi:hypothetical protein
LFGAVQNAGVFRLRECFASRNTHCAQNEHSFLNLIKAKDILPGVDLSSDTAALPANPSMALTDNPADRVARKHPRFRLDVEVKVRSKVAGMIVGRGREISEAGMSIMLVPELTVGEVVELDFELPFGPANILAVVKSRNAFRYGFQFVQPHAAESRIRQSCGILPPSN